MRSTEASNVDANGFVRPVVTLPQSNIGMDLTLMLRRVIEQVSPVTVAVAVTAFLSAGAFVAFDGMRTLDEASGRVDLIALSFAAELSGLDSSAVAETLSRRASFYGDTVQASLRAPDGVVIASTKTAEDGAFMPVAMSATSDDRLTGDAVAGSQGTLSVRIDQADALSGVWPRGAGAFGFALLIALFSYRRRAPAAAPVKDQRDHFADLISTIPFGVACWSATGDLVTCNAHYTATLSQDDNVAPSLAVSYHSAVRQLAHGGYMRLVSEDDNNRLLELHREDGSCLLIDERPLAEGGFVTFVTDVTERKRTDVLLNSIREEQRLLARRYHEEKIKAEAASRSKTSFLAHLSHDIRTPLNHIIGFADLMRHQTYGPLGDPRYVDYVETIKGSGERLLASFATILDLAELESGQKTLREERLNVDDLIVQTTRRFSAQAARAGLTLAIGAECGALLMADKFCLERMLGNIVENAIRFTPAGGKVTLAAFAASDGVVLEISDTGIGMTEGQMASLAQSFVLGDAAFTREHGGTGLGIAIARAIAELSGGRLAIDSSPAMGTTVAISLPLRNAAAQPAQALRASRAA